MHYSVAWRDTARVLVFMHLELNWISQSQSVEWAEVCRFSETCRSAGDLERHPWTSWIFSPLGNFKSLTPLEISLTVALLNHRTVIYVLYYAWCKYIYIYISKCSKNTVISIIVNISVLMSLHYCPFGFRSDQYF